MQDLTHATVANPGELPPDTVCDSGWFFEIYHQRIDYPDIQAIEVHVACTHPTLEDACEHVADLAGFLMSTHLMAGNVDGQMPGIGWTPYGPVTTSERQPIRIEHLGRSVERPAITSVDTSLVDVTKVHLEFPPPRLAGVRCEDGWVMSYSRAAIDAPAQIVSVRAVCGEPSLDQATDDFAEWIGALIQTRLIAMPTSAPDMHTTCDPLGDATAPDGRGVRFE